MSWSGEIVSIHIAPAVGEPMQPIASSLAEAGKGLAGDRYHTGSGFYSWFTGPLREVSLIEEETLDALARDHNLPLEPGITRRNIVTRGVPLNHLVDRDFKIGTAVFRGVKLCEPCGHVVDVTGITGLLPNLIHRGGLHAAIVVSGEIRVGDAIEPIELSEGI